MGRYRNKNMFWEMIISAFCVFGIIWALFFVMGYVPFGNKSLTSMDADYQYLDLFAYLKDVLSGKNSVSYSFSKTMGGPCIGIFSYYLASPFNLLVVFFKKSGLMLFFHVVVTLKLMCAAVTCVYFLNKRFELSGRNEIVRNTVVVILSVSYALCQYSIAQASNIMWLDGVYMLPLMMLGVYRLVRYKKCSYLAVTVGLSVLFNWYVGGINCLFVGFWFIFELVLYYTDNTVDFSVKKLLWDAVRFVYGMCTGVFISGVLFLPTIGAMRYSGRGQLDLGGLIDPSFTGNVFSFIESNALGSASSFGNVSLYCGSFALLGCICFFAGRRYGVKEKLIRGVMLLIMLLFFYWTPLYTAFSMFKKVGSYWYRYSYVGVMCIIFVAAEFFLKEDLKKNAIRMVTAAVCFSFAMGVVHLWLKGQPAYLVLRTIAFMCLVALLIYGIFGMSYSRHRWLRKAVAWGFVFVVALQTAYGAGLQMRSYHVDKAVDFKEYVGAMDEMTTSLRKYDGGDYRVNQTCSRNALGRGLRANYDEPLAYSIWGLSGYTSSPDAVSISLMDRLGYRKSDENMCAVNTSVLAADSLLGVKYVLSNCDINGLVKNDDIKGTLNGINVYNNPYWLPMALTYKTAVSDYADDSVWNELNPFEYQEKLYSMLLGEKADIYIPLEYKIIKTTDAKREYKIYIPDGEYSIYGNIPWNSEFQAMLKVNKQYATGYSRWISPSVFDIPAADGDAACYVRVVTKNKLDIKEGEEQFYALDLKRLAAVTETLRSRSADSIQMKNGYAMFKAYVNEGESLYISIPYSAEWTIEVNGKEVTPDLIDRGLYSVRLADGENTVRMSFRVKYRGLGIAVSLIGLFMLIMSCKKKKHKN